ncbi:MAG: hypothetical protein ACTSPI_06370 [Candidatus Heimdallarchaeaceae archaeon]
MSQYKTVSNNIVSALDEIEDLVRRENFKGDEIIKEYILERLKHFRYRYAFLNLPIRESDSWEIYALRKKLKNEKSPTGKNRPVKNEKRSIVPLPEEGFQVTYDKTGAVHNYKYCLLANVTYQQNKKLVDKCKEYSTTNPTDKKFFIFKQWIPDLKEHAIYCDSEDTLEELARFVVEELGGSIRRVQI